MSPEVIAAIIVGVLTVVGTLAAQFFGLRATRNDTKEKLKDQRDQLDRTLKEQHKQLDKTLKEQRDELDRTLAEQRTRTLNERFATAADMMGADKSPAIRLAGVHAMAGLADDWEENRQTCVDVLCAYLRLPDQPDPGDDAPVEKRISYRASREVRQTVIRVIAAHLRDNAAMSWQSLNFDFTGAVFDGGNFIHAKFTGGVVEFRDAVFSGPYATFFGARFSGARISFADAQFKCEANFKMIKCSGGHIDFTDTQFANGVSFWKTQFSGGEVDFSGVSFPGGSTGNFRDAIFSGATVRFTGAQLDGGRIDFGGAEFSGGRVDFSAQFLAELGATEGEVAQATFSRGAVNFQNAVFSGGQVDLGGAEISGGRVDFRDAQFRGGGVSFAYVQFLGGQVSFDRATFSGGQASFDAAEFSGTQVSFDGTEFSGGEVNFSGARDWSHPPTFDWDSPPPGVKLPAAGGGASS